MTKNTGKNNSSPHSKFIFLEYYTVKYTKKIIH